MHRDSHIANRQLKLIDGLDHWDVDGWERSFRGATEIVESGLHTRTLSHYLRNHYSSIMATTTDDHTTFGNTGDRYIRDVYHFYAKYHYYNPSNTRWPSHNHRKHLVRIIKNVLAILLMVDKVAIGKRIKIVVNKNMKR